MMPHNTPQQRLLVWWMLWFSLIAGVILIYFIIGRTPAAANTPPDADGTAWLFGTIPVLISISLLWAVLPRLQSSRTVLAAFVFGMALAEASAFLGMFVWRGHHAELVALALLGMLQYMPTYAARYTADSDDVRP